MKIMNLLYGYFLLLLLWKQQSLKQIVCKL